MTWTRRILLGAGSAALSITMLAGGASAATPTVTGRTADGAEMRVAAATRHPVNLERACVTQYPGQNLHAFLFAPYGALNWACTNTPKRTIKKGINITRACRVQYPGHPTAQALYFDVKNPNSWSCVF